MNALSIFLVIKKAKLLNRCVLFYCKWMDIWNILKTAVKTCHFLLEMMKCWINITKVREFDGIIKTNVLGNKVPKENMHYTCIVCVTIDSVVKIDKKKLSVGLFRRM